MRLIKKKRERTKINSENEEGDIMRYPAEIWKALRRYYEQLNAHKREKFRWNGNIPWNNNLPKVIHEEMKIFNNSLIIIEIESVILNLPTKKCWIILNIWGK